MAGQCGLGVLYAAEEQNVYGIGVDADQCYLGDHVLTSALKKVDVAVFQTIQAVRTGTFAGGADTVFDVASGGVGIGEIAADVPAEIVVARCKRSRTRSPPARSRASPRPSAESSALLARPRRSPGRR